MNNLSAALGLAQLPRLPTFLEAKRAVAARYASLLQTTPLQPLETEPGEEPSQWMVLARLECPCEDFPMRVKHIVDHGIEVRLIWPPVAHHVPYAEAPYFGEGYEEACYKSMVCLPSSVTLSESEQRAVALALTDGFARQAGAV